MKFIITTLVLIFPVMGMFCGCQKKEESKTMHFGPSPGDGECEGENAKEMHFGPSPDDGDTEKVEESFHFGPSPGDGVID